MFRLTKIKKKIFHIHIPLHHNMPEFAKNQKCFKCKNFMIQLREKMVIMCNACCKKQLGQITSVDSVQCECVTKELSTYQNSWHCKTCDLFYDLCKCLQLKYVRYPECWNCSQKTSHKCKTRNCQRRVVAPYVTCYPCYMKHK